MHEVSIAEEIKDIVIKNLKKNNAKKVKRIVLQIGKLTSIVPDALLFAFEVISKNTPLENAKVEIETIEIKAKCKSCKKVFKLENFEYQCPSCKKTDFQIIEGREMVIRTIEMEG